MSPRGKFWAAVNVTLILIMLAGVVLASTQHPDGAVVCFLIAIVVLLAHRAINDMANSFSDDPPPPRQLQCPKCGSNTLWEGRLIHYTDCSTGEG